MVTERRLSVFETERAFVIELHDEHAEQCYFDHLKINDVKAYCKLLGIAYNKNWRILNSRELIIPKEGFF